MPIKITYTDEKDKEEKLRKLQEQYQQRYNETFGNSKQNSSSNDSNNINTNTQNNINIWDQIKTTASNMLGNTGYGIANGIIGFVQNERRNKTSQNALNLLENAVATTNPIINILNQSKNIGNAMDKTLQKNEAYKNNKSKFEEGKNNLLNKLDQRLQNQEDINNEKIQQNIEETTNPVGKKLVELAPSIGQMLPSAIPGVGTLYSVGSATDSYYDEAKTRGMNDEQASRYSQLMGGAEGLTEMIGIGKLVKGGKGIAKGTIKEGFKDLGISVADNFIQEAVTEPISEIVTKGTAGDQYLKNDYRTTEGWKQLGKDMLQSGLDGAITAGIMSGVSAGLGKSVNIYNKLRNNQEITTNEIKSAFDEQRENGIDIDNITKDKFLDNIQKSQQNTNNISNNTNVDTTSMNLLDSAKAYNLNANDETIKSINQKLNDRGITSRFDETLFKDANGNTRTDVNALWRTTTDENGNIQRDVIFNPKANTNKTMQQVSIHEMLHDMQGTKEFEDLSKLILDKNSTREGYSDARKNLEELYSQVYDKNSEDFQSLINEEEVADTLAQKLGDQEFINSLNKEKPTVFKRIYDWVVDKLNKFTGSKNEKLYWEDVKNKFESAYRQDYQGASNSNRFSIQTDSNGNKFVKIDTNQDIFKGKTLSEQTKIAKQYILDNFRDKGLKLDDENVNVTSKTANEYTHPKNQLPYKTKQAKIKASTELDNMLNVSDYQYSSNDDGRHRFAKDGWDYYKTVFEVDGVKFEGLVNIAKSGDKKTFYDVTNIKRISQNRSASDKSFSTSLTNSNNSIPTSNEDVNTTNNNSMQESENNTKNSVKPSIEQSGAWQSFLENQIGPTGKGKTVQELKLSTKETINITKNNTENLPDTKQFLVEKRSKTKVPIKKIKDEIAQKVINKGYYIDKLSKKTGDKNLTYLYDRTLNSFNEAQISIGENQVNSNGEVVGKSLNDIFKQAEDMQLNVDFEDYLLNKHNIARTSFGKSLYGDNVSAPQSKRIAENYEKRHPEFKEWAKEVNKYNDNNLKDLVDNGLVSKETYDKLKEMYGDYVPTYRDITETMQEFDDNRIGSSTLKAATKSDKKILSVKESMAEQTLAIKKAIRINNIGKELYKILGKDSKIMDGIEVDPTLMYTIDGEVVEKAKDGQNTFAIFNDGEITYFKINDEIYSAFSKDTLQNRINNSEVAKALLTPVERISQAQRNLLTTYSIGFAFNNPIKDFQDAVFNSKYGTGQFLKNYSKALYNIAKNGDWYKSYKNNGGTANTYFDYNKGLLPTKTKNPIKKFVNKIRDANEILEQAPRLAEYISTIENNGSIDEALYNSAEITTNFKRGGDIAKVANKYGANFLNASIQGLDKFYRNLSGQNGWKGYASLLTKATLFQVVPSIVNGLLLKDDDDYNDLPEYTKDNYFLFKIGDGKFFRIPKGRVSSLIGGLARRVLETAEGKKVDWKSLVDTTLNQMAPNNPFSDNVLAPIKQAIENEAWYGGEIVSSRLQKLPTSEQYDEKTDNLSKIIGKYTGISPKKINYVLDQYSGGIGDVLLPMMTPQAENNILEDKFTTDAVLKNKNVSKYYDEVDKLEKNKNSESATDKDILKYKYMTEVSKDLSDLYSEKRDIENSNLSDKEKKVKVREVQREINNIVEERLNNVETIDNTSTTAKIGDSQYYKYHGEWTKLSDDEKEKNKNISLKSYADFKNKIYNETEKQRKSGELKENQQLKNTSKSNILLKSNYSDKEKLELYKNYVSSTDKKVEVAVEKLNMPINVYLNYKTNEFENDKDNEGETISGTKKNKVYNYVNNLNNVDLIYKYMILKMEDINDTDGDKAIINFVNKSKKFDFEGRKEALKTLGFKVDKYGNVENMIFIPIKSKIK